MSRKFLKSVALTLCLSVAVPLFNTINAFATTQPSIMGESAITMDLDTGEIIYSKNADEKRSPASTTKLLTSLLFAENKSKFLTTKEYYGYGQILKISDDGIEKHIVVKPKDPVFGITIKFLETGHPQFLIPAVSIEDIAIMLKNLEKARTFCKEFYERRDEFI